MSLTFIGEKKRKTGTEFRKLHSLSQTHTHTHRRRQQFAQYFALKISANHSFDLRTQHHRIEKKKKREKHEQMKLCVSAHLAVRQHAFIAMPYANHSQSVSRCPILALQSGWMLLYWQKANSLYIPLYCNRNELCAERTIYSIHFTAFVPLPACLPVSLVAFPLST